MDSDPGVTPRFFALDAELHVHDCGALDCQRARSAARSEPGGSDGHEHEDPHHQRRLGRLRAGNDASWNRVPGQLGLDRRRPSRGFQASQFRVSRQSEDRSERQDWRCYQRPQVHQARPGRIHRPQSDQAARGRRRSADRFLWRQPRSALHEQGHEKRTVGVKQRR